MNNEAPSATPAEAVYEEPLERVGYDFGLDRRSFVQFLGAGLLIAVGAAPVLAQERARRDRGPQTRNVAARVHIAKDGTITVLTGKVEGGQGARAELTQAAAEELRVPMAQVHLLMADTELVPDDGITAGSRSTPSTVPAVREGTAAARELLLEKACKQWGVERSAVEVKDGRVSHSSNRQTLTYAELASDEEVLRGPVPPNVTVTPVSEWRALGISTARPNARDLITGSHKYPSDVTLPGMYRGKILRPPSYGAKLVSLDSAPAKALKDVTVVQDEQFVGVVAPDTYRAEKALDLLARSAKWDHPPHPSSRELFDYLKAHVHESVPANPFADELAAAASKLQQSYHVAYAQHAPLEPRAAVAEWQDGKLTVWAGTQNPFGHRGELARAFHLSPEKVRVIVPDFGSGYGGKHTAEAAVEAARLAQAAGRPVALRWTREEEFTWAYFRPAALIEIEATLNSENKLTSWHFININSGGSAIDTPYQAGKSRSHFVNSEAPLRQGSYRGLAATANNFARESFMDELAHAAHSDPLDFRLAHLENPRLRAVLEKAASEFGWKERVAKKKPGGGVGLACGTEKGSYVAACVEVSLEGKKIRVEHVCEAFECGAILNPQNLQNQVQGAIIMGLGPALREEMRFENGEMLNASFRGYPVPRFADIPEIDIHLLNRPDLAPAGAGETPIIAVAPAIANAVFQTTGVRIREMPIRLPEATG